jgi:diguanylate cyclase (GGDEF)-like protein/PAS domain S-box-containing protein
MTLLQAEAIRHEAQAKHEDSELFYKSLVESTRAIPWRIDWATLSFTYIGPQIEELLGWKQDSWKTVQDWADRMHPKDRQFVVDFCVSQSRSGVDHEADYRAICADGREVWIRDVVHVMRDDKGDVTALVGFMFDISERKAREEELIRLKRELEILSYKDGLTGIANRRMFDVALGREWAVAQKEDRPLSLVMIDIDFFKLFNDAAGHLGGDTCLKEVAKLLESALQRPADLIARYGGEEFAILLPDTNVIDAQVVAERCRELIANAQIPHPNSPLGPYVTISAGVGDAVPNEMAEFIDSVDQALYRAKKQGRNCVSSNRPLPSLVKTSVA